MSKYNAERQRLWRATPEGMAMTRKHSKRYNASEKGRVRMMRYLASPKGKIMRAKFQDAHREQRRIWDADYRARHPKPKVFRPCATLLCEGMVWPAHGQKFCTKCRNVFGYTKKTRWWHRRGKYAQRAA